MLLLNLHITKQPPEKAFVFDYSNTKALFFFYTKYLFSYVIIGLIGGDPMNAYLRTDSYTTTEKLVVSHMLQVFCMGIR